MCLMTFRLVMQGCVPDMTDIKKVKAMQRRVPMHFTRHEQHLSGRKQASKWVPLPMKPVEQAEAGAEN